MRPILFVPGEVNQTLPSGPPAIPLGPAFVLMPAVNSVATAAVVMRPIRPTSSLNQRLPSTPAVIAHSRLFVLIPDPVDQSVMAPLGVTRPIRLPTSSVNHMFPSGPGVMPSGTLPETGSSNSVILTACADGTQIRTKSAQSVAAVLPDHRIWTPTRPPLAQRSRRGRRRPRPAGRRACAARRRQDAL